jgi:hypothetical protein
MSDPAGPPNTPPTPTAPPPTSPPPASPPPTSRPPVGLIVAVVLGALGLLIGLFATAGGGFLLWAHGTQRDAAGFFTTGNERFETAAHAITADDIDLGADPAGNEGVYDLGDLATIRIAAEAVDDGDVFVGIGPADEVDDYLDGVSRATIDDIDLGPFRVSYDYDEGDAPTAPPTAQDFWVASADGEGRQSIEWDLESGDWNVVLMAADGSAPVAVDASVGAKADWVLAAAIGLFAFGLFSVLGGAALLVFGAVGLSRRLTDAPAPGPASAGPLALTGRLDDPSRWLWLVKWILVIPHLIALAVLWLAAAVVTFIAFFAILFTGRYPRSLFDFVVGVMRWTWRVGFYSLQALATDQYPPFSLGAEPDYPATLDVAYPEQLSRGLVLVKWWLLAIPHYLVLAFLVGGGYSAAQTTATGGNGYVIGGGLLALLVLFAGVALLFSNRYPGGLFDLVMGLNRWAFRVGAYVGLLTDDYPPFRLDQGPDEPPALSPGSAPDEMAARPG